MVPAPSPAPQPIEPPHEVSPPTDPGKAIATRPRDKGARERFSRSLTLHDGEQEVLLDGQASIGADFTAVGGLRVATLHVGSPGKEISNHAILSAGERFEIHASGRNYYVYVTKLDLAAMTMQVTIEEQL